MSRLADRSRRPAAKLAASGRAPYLTTVTDPIHLTASAARRVAIIAKKQGKPPVLRLSVDGGGCAGFSYNFALGDPAPGDARTMSDGVTLVVDPVSLDLVVGSAVDYVEDLGGSAFKVTNPNAASGCGCGSSFSV
jgi:iron-sulfur cluster assembly accessory protein